MRLMALYPILFESHQYKVGDSLPASNKGMVQAWLDAGTAKWKTDASEELEVEPEEQYDEKEKEIKEKLFDEVEEVEQGEEGCASATNQEEDIQTDSEESESCTGATKTEESDTVQEPVQEESQGEKEVIGRSAKNAARKKGDK